MPVDPFVELFNAAAIIFDRAAVIAHSQHSAEKTALAQKFRNQTLAEVTRFITAPYFPPALGSEAARQNPPRPLKTQRVFAPLPGNWAERLRQRLLRLPGNQQKASQCALGFHCATDALVDAARRHSWFVCQPPPKGGGWRISLADDAAQEPPPAAIVIPPDVPLSSQPSTPEPRP